MSEPKSKVCACCQKRKSLDQFGKNSRMALGRKSYCRPCSAAKQRIWNKVRREADVLA